MPYDTFRLEPDLGDELWLVDVGGRVYARFSLVRLFQVLGKCETSPAYSRRLAMELHFDPRRPPSERVYWAEQSGVAAEVMQLMRTI